MCAYRNNFTHLVNDPNKANILGGYFFSAACLFVTNLAMKVLLLCFVELDIDTLVVVGVETLKDVEIDQEVHTELELEILKFK